MRSFLPFYSNCEEVGVADHIGTLGYRTAQNSQLSSRSVHYRSRDNRLIVLILGNASLQKLPVDAWKEKCKAEIFSVKRELGIDPDTGAPNYAPDAKVSRLGTFFVHQDGQEKEESVSVGAELDAIAVISVFSLAGDGICESTLRHRLILIGE